jgi:hypothetical protein
MDLSLKNQCAEALSCQMHWTLSCRGDQGRTVKRQVASFDVGEGETHSVQASASSCGNDAVWRIADVTWSCKSSPGADARRREPATGGGTAGAKSPRRTGR